jgi:hypothetical protein
VVLELATSNRGSLLATVLQYIEPAFPSWGCYYLETSQYYVLGSFVIYPASLLLLHGVDHDRKRSNAGLQLNVMLLSTPLAAQAA